jgi:hypothetical protein
MTTDFVLTKYMGSFGETIYESILMNPQMITIVFFFFFFIGITALFRVALAKPFKQHKKEKAVISMMLAFMVSSSLVFMFKDDPTKIVTFLGGGATLVLMLGVFGGIFYAMHKKFGEDDNLKRFKLLSYSIFGLFASLFTIYYVVYLVKSLSTISVTWAGFLRFVQGTAEVVFWLAILVIIIETIKLIATGKETVIGDKNDDEDGFGNKSKNEINKEKEEKLKSLIKDLEDEHKKLGRQLNNLNHHVRGEL